MNKEQKAALTEGERCDLFAHRTDPGWLLERFVTALADARLEVARLEKELVHWKANHDSQVAKKNSGAVKMKAHYEAEVARLTEERYKLRELLRQWMDEPEPFDETYDYFRELEGKVTNHRGPLALRSLPEKVRRYRWVQKIVNGALAGAINAHGPIDQVHLSSASKRVAGAINAELRKLFTEGNLTNLVERLRQAEKKGGDAMRRAEILEETAHLAIHKIEQTLAGQYREGQALKAALFALREAIAGSTTRTERDQQREDIRRLVALWYKEHPASCGISCRCGQLFECVLAEMKRVAR